MLSLVHEVEIASREPGVALPAFLSYRGYYFESLGLVVMSSGYWAIRLDGGAVRFSSNFGYGFGFDQETHAPVHFWNVENWQPIRLPVIEPLREARSELTTNDPLIYHSRSVAFYASGGSVWEIDLATQDRRVVCALPHSAGGILHPAGDGPCRRWWAMDRSSGWCVLWNEEANEVERSVRIDSGAAATGYSPRLGVFLAVFNGSPPVLRVYADEPVAASLSVPTFTPPPRRGALSTLSTVVLGADGEPCPNRVVRFEVTAGTVSPSAVLTDDEGVATTQFRAPGATASGATATATLDE